VTYNRGMTLQLEEKVALVTGSTAGIGFAIAAGLAGEGARVIVNGRSEKRVQDASSAISSGTRKRVSKTK
jgi:NADP-dependent 3-hydroxy acid dehydrogenase YdfG